ncbi:MAG: arginine--tRNA ligase [FCB group bacterium]|nr:arginine--tRNA ligase [FCB group bacterium]
MNPFESIAAPILAKFPELDASDLPFGPAPKIELGDIALPAFLSARKLKGAPPQVAARIAQEVAFGPEVQNVTVTGPYINFRLNRGQYARKIVQAILTEGDRYGSSNEGAGRKALVEHTSINPNASPHVGRARNAMIGDALVRLLRFQGYDVTVHYYVNDMGRQIALLVLAVDDPEKLTFDEMLDAYVNANARSEADPEFKAKGYDLLAKMEEGDPETARRFHAVTETCLRGQIAVLGRLDIHYDVFDRESRFLKDPRFEAVLEALREKDAVFVDEDNRLVVDLCKLGWPERPRDEGRYFVLMRANGSSMYGYRDLAYTMEKMEKGPDLNIAVFGEDHKLYAQQVGLILSAAGKPFPETVYYSYILLKEGKMSTRKGNVVLLSDFLDEAASLAGAKVDEQWPDLPADERRIIAEQIGVGAVRYAILRVGPNRNVTFDWESSLSFTGDTGPYIQYSCARTASILRKFGEVPAETAEDFPVESDSEWALVMKLATFPDTVKEALTQRDCSPVAQAALDTARLFTTFYHDCPVLAAESEAMRTARAQLCAAALQAQRNALNLLGIKALERM